MSDETITCYTTDGRAVAVPSERVTVRPSVYGVALTENRGQVLLTRARASSVWELPGGGIEPGERVTDALAREFKEEVGLDATVGPPIYFADAFFYHDHDGRDEGWHSLKLYYLVAAHGTLDPHYEESRESGDVNYGAAWVPVDELDGVAIQADHYDAVQRAIHWLEATEGPVAGDDDDE